jgi:hypothetical protein
MGNCASAESVAHLEKTIKVLKERSKLDSDTINDIQKAFVGVYAHQGTTTKALAAEKEQLETLVKLSNLNNAGLRELEQKVNTLDLYRAWVALYTHLKYPDLFRMNMRIVNATPTTYHDTQLWKNNKSCGCQYADYVKTINWHSPTLEYKLSGKNILLKMTEQIECHWDSAIEFGAHIHIPSAWIDNFSMEDVSESYQSNGATFFTMEKMMNKEIVQDILGAEIEEPMSVGSFLASCMRSVIEWKREIVPTEFIPLEDKPPIEDSVIESAT